MTMKIELRAEGCLVHDHKLLLVNHINPQASYWVLPGGHVELGETLQEALAREMMEELSLEVEVGPLVMVHQFIRHDRQTVNFTFQLICHHPEELRLHPHKKLQGYDWVDAERLRGLDVKPPMVETLQGFIRGEFPGKLHVFTFGL